MFQKVKPWMNLSLGSAKPFAGYTRPDGKYCCLFREYPFILVGILTEEGLEVCRRGNIRFVLTDEGPKIFKHERIVELAEIPQDLIKPALKWLQKAEPPR